MEKRRFGVLALIMLAGVCASLLMWWITDLGPGVSPDSTVYIETAKNVLAGNGFFAGGEPTTYGAAYGDYPPAYPLLLAIVGLSQHGDIIRSGRLLGALLYGINLVLFVIAVRMCTARSRSATGCAVFVFLSSTSVMTVHAMAWSEPSFIAFTLAAFVLLSLHVLRPTTFSLMVASVMVGFAMATRYAGVALLPTMASTLLLLGDRSMKQRVRDVFLASTVASLPLAAWLIRNLATSGTAINRVFAIHLFGISEAKAFINTMYDYALPITFFGWTKTLHLAVVAALVLVTLVLLHRRNYIKHNAHSIRITLPTICFVFCLWYIVFFVISISFFDANTAPDNRLMLPVFLALSVAMISLVWSLSLALDQRFIWYSFMFFAFFSISMNISNNIYQAVDIHEKGRGYTSRHWQSSEIISYLEDVGDDRIIYSNGPDAIRFLTEKEAITIPKKFLPRIWKANEEYEDQFSRLVVECTEGRVLIAHINGIGWRNWYLPSIEEFESAGNLPVLRRLKDGVIFGVPAEVAAQDTTAAMTDAAPLLPAQRY